MLGPDTRKRASGKPACPKSYMEIFKTFIRRLKNIIDSREVTNSRRMKDVPCKKIGVVVTEDCDIGKTFCQTASVDNYECRLHNATNMLMASISSNYQLWRLIDRELTPLAAKWSGVARLKMNNVYGVRR